MPLGAFLSGGIDSSTHRRVHERGVAAQPVNTFSMGFDDGSYNELPYAREVAALFRTNHRERHGHARPRATLFERLVVHLDEPFADVSLFPTYHGVGSWRASTSRWRCRATAATSCSAATTPTRRRRWRRRLGWMGDALMPALAGVARGAAADREEEGPRQQGQALHRRRRDGAADLGHYRWMVFLGARGQGAALRAAACASALRHDDVYAPVREALGALHARTIVLNRQLYADLSLYLADDILVKVDRMSMATSLETRAPFLDGDVMELAFSMPGHLKIRNGERKWILKQAMRGIAARRDPRREEGRLQHPDEELAAPRAAAADARPAVAPSAWRAAACSIRPRCRG